MVRRSKILSAVCLFLAITASSAAGQSQAGGGAPMTNVPIHTGTGGASMVVSVFTPNDAHLGRPAVVKLYDANKKPITFLTTVDASAAFAGLSLGKYEIEVSAVGYLPNHTESEVLSAFNATQVKVILRPDPDAVDLDAGSASLPGKGNKEVKRAASELESGKIKDAQKDLDTAYKAAPSNAHVNFLLGYLAFLQNDLDHAQTYLQKATALDPHDIQALDTLGRLYLTRRDYAAATTTLQQAVAADTENAAAHSMLANAYLNQRDFKNALAQADLAIDKSKSVGGNAQIVRGEALADMGRNKEAIETLKTYLQNAPDTASAPQVRQLIAMIEQRDPKASSSAAEPAKP
jgi:tetratricopeptide (TPR) repeat protein